MTAYDRIFLALGWAWHVGNRRHRNVAPKVGHTIIRRTQNG